MDEEIVDTNESSNSNLKCFYQTIKLIKYPASPQ